MPLTYTPNRTADQFHLDFAHQIHALVGPWGCGKSQAAIWDVLQYQQRHPNADVLVVRDTYSALADSCVAQWMQTFNDYGSLSGGMIPDFNWDKRVRGQDGKPITGTVKFRAAQEAWQVQKFLSVEVGMAWLEEATPGITASGQLSQGLPPELFAGLWARVRQVKEERRLVLTSSPPPNDQHWFYTVFYQKKPLTDLKKILTGQGEQDIRGAGVEWDDVLSLVQRWELRREENLIHLPPGYYESLLPFLKTDDQVLRFYHGKVPQGSYSGWPVYPMWRDAVHLMPRLQAESGALVRGWDGGVTPACVWFQFPASGGVRILAELQGQDEGLLQFAPKVQAFGNDLFGRRAYIDIGDPAIDIRSQNDAQSGEDILRKAGIYLRHGVQDPWTRVQAVRSWLGSVGLVQVHPRCELLIAGFRGAYKRKLKDGVPTEKPDKEDPESNRHSHIMNCAEYVATVMNGDQPPEEQEPLPIQQLDRLGRWPQAPTSQRWMGGRQTRRGAH